jgi:hypothetical protein
LTTGSNCAFNLEATTVVGTIAEPSELSIAARPAVAP